MNRVEAGEIEDVILGDVVAELSEPHLDARLAAEVCFLRDMRHVFDPYGFQFGACAVPCSRGRAPEGHEHREQCEVGVEFHGQGRSL